MTDHHARWFEDTEKMLDSAQASLTPKMAKKLKLDLLRRVARRLAEFSDECGQCQVFQQDVTRLVQEIGNLPLMTKESRRAYSKKIKLIVRHLQHHHKLIPDGHYLGIGLAIGSGIGVALGVALGTAGAGMPIGFGVGFAIGKWLDTKAKNEGRVI
jgi:hypothetical protein